MFNWINYNNSMNISNNSSKKNSNILTKEIIENIYGEGAVQCS